jgi:hypothetical protein
MNATNTATVTKTVAPDPIFTAIAAHAKASENSRCGPPQRGSSPDRGRLQGL